MKTDALSRRLRFAPPNRLVKRLVLTRADYLIFEAIDRHGPLPTNFLYEFSKAERRNYLNLQHRLTEFYNGDAGGAYLVRPPQQFAGFEARYQHIVYDLAPRARQALAERGTLAVHTPNRASSFLHQLMGACVAASIELAAPAHGLRYISREEILSNPRGGKARNAPNPMSLPLRAGRLIPDDLFGLEGKDDQGSFFRFLAVEIDRNTESIERRKVQQTAFSQKVAGYREILRSRLYRDWWGVPNLSVLTITTNRVHAQNLIEFVAREPEYQERFAFAAEPSFSANWRVPKQILSYLLAEPWQTAKGPKDITRP